MTTCSRGAARSTRNALLSFRRPPPPFPIGLEHIQGWSSGRPTAHRPARPRRACGPHIGRMGYRVPFKVSSSLLLHTGTRHRLQYRYVSSESPRDAPWLRARESLGKSLTFYAEGNEGSERPAPFTCSLPVSGRVYRPRPAFADARAIRRMHDVTRVAMRPAGPSPASHTRTPVCPVDGRPRLPPSLQGFWDLHSQRLLLACRRTGQKA